MPTETAVATAPTEQYLCRLIDENIEAGLIDPSIFRGRKIRIDGYNYVLETKIVGIQFVVWKRFDAFKCDEEWRPLLQNICFKLDDTTVLVDKRRWKLVRTIDHLSWAPGYGFDGEIVVVFKDCGRNSIKRATITLID